MVTEFISVIDIAIMELMTLKNAVTGAAKEKVLNDAITELERIDGYCGHEKCIIARMGVISALVFQMTRPEHEFDAQFAGVFERMLRGMNEIAIDRGIESILNKGE